MPRTIRFHLDEHIAKAVANGLRRLGIDVTTSADAGLLGASDPEQLAYALAEGRVFFTQDSDFLALAGVTQHAGIVYCDQNTRTIGQMVRGLQLLWDVYEPDEMQNRVEFI
jgi:predicted nuclease of predicted toxin-antitoxin system